MKDGTPSTRFSRALTIGGICLLAGAFAMDGGNCETMPGNDGLTGQYVGSMRCAQCHTRIHQDWVGTLHWRALETLEAVGQDTNADCIGCHVTGYGEEGGFVSRALTNDLAGVGCEECHGPGRDHVENVADESLRPPKDLSPALCGRCHTGSHHPNYDEWSSSHHALVTETPAEEFEAGEALNNCGKCHSGEFFLRSIVNGETLEDDALLGQPREEQLAIACVVCHYPHAQTGNAAAPEEGRDYQLRFPEVASPIPTNTIDATTNAARFNVCGQCHHGRGRTWESTSRGPHGSVQSNVYVGEMAMPDSDEPVTPLVPSRVSVHSFAPEQCASCHLYRQDFMSDQAPAIAGHTFEVNNAGCTVTSASTSCHPTTAAAVAAQATLQTEIQAKLDDIRMLLGDPATWEYSSTGGPMDQSMISDDVKKARFLLKYVEADGSLGIHNPDYVRDMLDEAEALLTP